MFLYKKIYSIIFNSILLEITWNYIYEFQWMSKFIQIATISVSNWTVLSISKFSNIASLEFEMLNFELIPSIFKASDLKKLQYFKDFNVKILN